MGNHFPLKARELLYLVGYSMVVFTSTIFGIFQNRIEVNDLGNGLAEA